MSRERKLRPLRADKVKEGNFAKIFVNKKWKKNRELLWTKVRNNEKFAATRECEKWERKLTTN